MKRILAASFFVTYIVVLGLWPTSRWWMEPSFMTWTMYSRGIGDGKDHPLIEATFKDGRRLAFRTVQERPFYRLYAPEARNPLFRFTEKPRFVNRVAAKICQALPEANVIHYSEAYAVGRSFPCQR